MENLRNMGHQCKIKLIDFNTDISSEWRRERARSYHLGNRGLAIYSQSQLK